MDVQERWSTICNYGPSKVIYLMMISVLVSLFFQHKKFTPLMALVNLVIFMILLPEGTMYYWFIALNPLSLLCIITLLYHFNKVNLKFYIKFKRWSFKLSTGVIILILLFILPDAFITRLNYINNFTKNVGEGYFSYIQTYDIQASKVILTKYSNERVIILSDPGTMFFLGGLTGKDTLLTEYIYFIAEEYSNETWYHMDCLKAIFKLIEDQRFNNTLLFKYLSNQTQMESFRVLIIITPRTYYWLYENVKFPVNVKPLDVSNLRIVQTIENMNNIFELSYSTRYLYIYEMRH
jgi:hypothetical protein